VVNNPENSKGISQGRTVKHSISTQFNCTLARVFKTPILGDATKFMTAYRLQPAIVGFEDDET
tara:strand:+ start:103 stop:291 length:189 start_codon:yes stop_codon:yes gene_type:complete